MGSNSNNFFLMFLFFLVHQTTQCASINTNVPNLIPANGGPSSFIWFVDSTPLESFEENPQRVEQDNESKQQEEEKEEEKDEVILLDDVPSSTRLHRLHGKRTSRKRK